MPSNQVVSGQVRTGRPSIITKRTRATISSSQQVRSKYFQSIGISSNRRSSNISVAERSRRDLRDIPRHHISLQYDRKEERLREEQRESRRRMPVSPVSSAVDISQLEARFNNDSKSTQKKQVGFQETVTVVPIPMSCEYSDRIRRKLWCDAVEICEGVERNLIEFNAENLDWRTACLEDEMYRCGVTGVLIHPVHVETKQYVFGAAAGFRRSNLPNERKKYWSAKDVV